MRDPLDKSSWKVPWLGIISYASGIGCLAIYIVVVAAVGVLIWSTGGVGETSQFARYLAAFLGFLMITGFLLNVVGFVCGIAGLVQSGRERTTVLGLSMNSLPLGIIILYAIIGR